ncbi:DUF99 family protein [Candidatus Woesearchaeota archaeon]|nr:DUF99 family protein [Candidatus Woesearchaeota archaeon]
MREEIRFLGIDDGPFDKFNEKDKEVLVIGSVYRGNKFLDGLISCHVEKDGEDSTEKIIKMINNSKFKEQIRCVFLDGIAVGGFNIVNPEKLGKKTNIPVIVIIRKYPDFEELFNAMKKAGKEKYIEFIKKLPEPKKHEDIWFQNFNIEDKKAEEFIEMSRNFSNIPECLRASHLIASGIKKGESKGQA